MSLEDTPENTVEPRERRPARLAELLLLLLALAAGIGAFAMVGFSMEGHLPEGFWVRSVTLAALAIGAHVVLRLRAPWADQVILPAVVLLNGIGLTMIMRLELADMNGADATRNMQWSALGVVL